MVVAAASRNNKRSHENDANNKVEKMKPASSVYLRLYSQGVDLIEYKKETFKLLGKTSDANKDCDFWNPHSCISRGVKGGVTTKKMDNNVKTFSSAMKCRKPNTKKRNDTKRVQVSNSIQTNIFERKKSYIKINIENVENGKDSTLDPPTKTPNPKRKCSIVKDSTVPNGFSRKASFKKKKSLSDTLKKKLQDSELTSLPRRFSMPAMCAGKVPSPKGNNNLVKPQCSKCIKQKDGSETTTSTPSNSPSKDTHIHKLQEQIQVLKDSMGLSEEDVQWKVDSAKGNAYIMSESRLQKAEEDYDRLMYEDMVLQQQLHGNDGNSVQTLVTYLKDLAKCTKDIVDLTPQVTKQQETVVIEKKKLMEARVASELKLAKSKRGDLSFNSSNVANETRDFMQKLECMKEDLLKNQELLKKAIIKQGSLHENVSKQIEVVQDLFNKCRSSSDEHASTVNALLEILEKMPYVTQEKLIAASDHAAKLAAFLIKRHSKEIHLKKLELDQTLKDIEIWRNRKQNAKEYIAETKAAEIDWKEQNNHKNSECLKRIRSIIPKDIKNLTVEGIIKCANEKTVIYTRDLANYIKQNKLLHWTVMHTDDIRRENFLAGASAQDFNNFEQYDITELRAVYECLPESFEFDRDNRKAEWRESFVAYLKVLVSQENRETVKTGWDPINKQRKVVQLKDLSEKQKLNPFYRYLTPEETKSRLQKFEQQASRLNSKISKLKRLNEVEIPDLKGEYNAVSKDARSEYLQQTYGKATLNKLRDTAKRDYQNLCKQRDQLKSEISHAEKLALESCPTYDQFLEEIEKTKVLDMNKYPNLLIPGPFDECPQISPRKQITHKKLSVEEEAKARHNELSKAIAQRSRSQDVKKSEVEQKNLTISAIPAEASRMINPVKASPQVLKFLENQFCSPKGHASFRRTKSSDCFRSKKEADDRTPAVAKQVEEKKDCEIKMVKPTSKSLLRHISSSNYDNIEKENNQTSKPLSFLEQLKCRSSCKKADESSKNKPNFLQELQAKAKKTTEPVDSKPKISFLDELKMKSKSKEIESGSTENRLKLTPKVTHTSTSSNASTTTPTFLEELKQKGTEKSNNSAGDIAKNFEEQVCKNIPKPTHQVSLMTELKLRLQSTIK